MPLIFSTGSQKTGCPLSLSVFFQTNNQSIFTVPEDTV